MKSIDELTAEHNRRMKKIEVEFRQKMSELDEKEKEIGEINKKNRRSPSCCQKGLG